MTISTIRDLVMRLSVSTGTLSALGAALEERVLRVQLDPAVKAELARLPNSHSGSIKSLLLESAMPASTFEMCRAHVELFVFNESASGSPGDAPDLERQTLCQRRWWPQGGHEPFCTLEFRGVIRAS